MRHDRRCFGRLGQEDQRLKKHYGPWMDIVESLELELFILTKVDKGPHPSQLSRPTSQPPTKVGPNQQGEYSFFWRNKEALPCCSRGPSYHPLHIQYSSDGSHSLTTLTTSH